MMGAASSDINELDTKRPGVPTGALRSTKISRRPKSINNRLRDALDIIECRKRKRAGRFIADLEPVLED